MDTVLIRPARAKNSDPPLVIYDIADRTTTQVKGIDHIVVDRTSEIGRYLDRYYALTRADYQEKYKKAGLPENRPAPIKDDHHITKIKDFLAA